MIEPEIFPLFGRDDENIAEEYFGAVNQFYLGLNRLENDLADKLASIGETNPSDISREDFESDVLSSIKPITEGKRLLAEKINKQRKKWGW